MSRSCEVCDTMVKQGYAVRAHRSKLSRLLVGGRIVALCDSHAKRVRKADPPDEFALRELFPEPGGNRSLLQRRSPLDRRIFPARPEGRRRGDGRRNDDLN
jgi:hypothetical protein